LDHADPEPPLGLPSGHPDRDRSNRRAENNRVAREGAGEGLRRAADRDNGDHDDQTPVGILLRGTNENISADKTGRHLDGTHDRGHGLATGHPESSRSKSVPRGSLRRLKPTVRGS
jgi:hypothetical protein